MTGPTILGGGEATDHISVSLMCMTSMEFTNYDLQIHVADGPIIGRLSDSTVNFLFVPPLRLPVHFVFLHDPLDNGSLRLYKYSLFTKLLEIRLGKLFPNHNHMGTGDGSHRLMLGDVGSSTLPNKYQTRETRETF